jgi:hypothetical protein
VIFAFGGTEPVVFFTGAGLMVVLEQTVTAVSPEYRIPGVCKMSASVFAGLVTVAAIEK